ncbi:hypothetical protein L202_05761 [Cryptococcus amylolentus CBS 6039]|uniref:BTB domain-containing protein n=1 Tax=Cryptococcus amylolentus CBS 6039 TaxID=1295533 RepID=A0A1E3HHC9_9TREE|nr:hypothetical protein L202_05761 [Cryptococcus amylolentus CBS 6039]ODN75749.1 hypothetical protein L202_05761 [Cryptococcus amylolentus CBS 6039]
MSTPAHPTPLPSPPASHDGYCCAACRREEIGEPGEPEVDEIWNDESADVVLVSSDNVAFWVPGYHIMSQSTALRDALQINTTLPSPSSLPTPNKEPIRITLTDEDCETSSALRFFLHLSTHGSPSSLLPKYPKEIVKMMLEGMLFMRKYDCAPAQSLGEMWMRTMARGQGEWAGEGAGEGEEKGWGKSLSALDLFLISAKTGMDGVMVDCVKYYKPRGRWVQPRFADASSPSSPPLPEPIWEKDEYIPMLNERYGWGAYTGLTPGEFPILAWEACPPLVLWALTKACEREEGWEKRGECLEGILGEVGFLR